MQTTAAPARPAMPYRSETSYEPGDQDHEEIRRWVEERNGRPARVKATAGDGGGILRIDFREPDQGLEPIEWEEFFEIFEGKRLAMVQQEETAEGKVSRFAKFVAR
jgi:hypothetical protein